MSAAATLSPTTARMFAELVTECMAAGVKSADVAAAASWSLKVGALSEAQARGHMQTLRFRLAELD